MKRRCVSSTWIWVSFVVCLSACEQAKEAQSDFKPRIAEPDSTGPRASGTKPVSSTGPKIEAKAMCDPDPRGDGVLLSVFIENVGGEAAKGIRFTVSTPGSLFPTTVEYGSLEPGKSDRAVMKPEGKVPAGTIRVKVSGQNFESVSTSAEYRRPK